MDEHRSRDQSEQEANRRMLAGLLAQRKLGFFNRLAARAEWRLGRWNEYWATLSRRGRRAFWRKAAPALVGAGLVTTLLIAAAPVGANSITVANGAVGISADAVCSLIEAIENANDTTTGQPHSDCAAGDPSGADTINLPVGGSFTLTSVFVYYNEEFGLPTITSNVTIEGNGSTVARSGAAPDFALMATSTSGTLTLNDITLSGGQGSAPVFGYGYAYGGGIVNKGDLYLNDSTLSGNSGVFGGAIFSRGNVVIQNSVFDDNSSVPVGGWASFGGAIYNWGGSLKVYNSEFTDNVAAHYAGAVVNMPKGGVGGYALIEGTTFSGNSTGDAGAFANIYSNAKVYDSTFHDNSTTSVDGGAVDNIRGTMTIGGSTFYDNSAARYGGAIYNSGDLIVFNTTISGNSATKGGGIHSTYTGSSLGLENSTVTDNTTTSNGGGVFNTVGTATLERSLIAGNTAGAAGREVFNSGTVVANASNIFGHGGSSGVSGFAPGATDIVPGGALATILDTTLANNGGPTMTHALPSGSPAVDAAPSAGCTAAPVSAVDQRALPRNVNGAGGASANECDIGAFERQDPPPPLPSLYVSPLTAGNVGVVPIAATPQDILVYDQNTGTWAMHFDGSDVGVTKIISSFAHLPGGDLLIVLKANQTLPVVGAVTPWDVVRFTPTSLGSTTAGTFSWYMDGSDVGLTTAAEKIDALDVLADGRVVVSTGGALSAPKTVGGTLKSQDEDLSVLNHTSLGATTAGTWALYFDGTAVTGLKAEDVTGAHVDEATGDRYITILGAFNVGGVPGNDKDVLKLAPSGGGYTVTKFWSGPLEGFNLKIGGIEME